MREQIRNRIESLRAEYRTGQEMLAELEGRQAGLKMTLTRISGAIQVLEELLQENIRRRRQQRSPRTRSEKPRPKDSDGDEPAGDWLRGNTNILCRPRHPSPLRIRDRLDGGDRARTAADARARLRLVVLRQRSEHLDHSTTQCQSRRQRRRRAGADQPGTGGPDRRKLGAAFQEENQDNVRHFPSRAAYLASFLADLAFGTARSQWYYQSFAGLNALPLSAALRTALCDDSRTGKQALRLFIGG